MAEVKGYENLYLVRVAVRDGENEYSDEMFCRAESLDDAHRQGTECVRRDCLYDPDIDTATVEDLTNEAGWIEEQNGYRWFKVHRVEKVSSLQEILNFITII